MKIFCEDCGGSGQSNEGFPYQICPTCKGKGYTVDLEIDRKIAVADALEFAFIYGAAVYDVEVDYDWEEEPILEYNFIAADTETLLKWFEYMDEEGVD